MTIFIYVALIKCLFFNLQQLKSAAYQKLRADVFFFIYFLLYGLQRAAFVSFIAEKILELQGLTVVWLQHTCVLKVLDFSKCYNPLNDNNC